jgi:maltooligosyltrehalose trehalohydrolase
MINLNILGATAAAPTASGVDAHFGLYLPGINESAGYEVRVKVIHHNDRFTAAVATMDFPLRQTPGDPYNLWQADIHLPTEPGTSFGTSGTYLYRYQLLQGGNVVTKWFTDPFARSTDDVGELSAVTTADSVPPFTWTDDAWKVPELVDLVVYELHPEQFNDTFDGIVARLAYLRGLGVTCIELMPVTSLKLDFDWGYGPLHYLAPNQRWGGNAGLKRLVDAAHGAGVAVIIDVVYQHVDPTFPYNLVYADTHLPSPMIGSQGPFGPTIDFNQPFSRDYVQAVGQHWLNEYHLDGFRYDEVTDLYDGPTGNAYAKMAFDAYSESLRLPRFTPSGGTAAGEYSRIIQAPEALNQPQAILANTYSNATWQDNLLAKVEAMAGMGFVDDGFAHLLDVNFSGYPATKTVQDGNGNPVDMPVAPFQYLESHDHSQLIAFVAGQPDAPMADRSRWYKLQPYAIALYTCQGIPMLWEGQEFADSYSLPNSGDARIHFRRNTHWEYFYDDQGGPLVRLYRILGSLRHAHPALRSRDSFYDNVNSRPSDGVIVYRRHSAPDNELALVFVNFSDQARTVSVPFPQPGVYQELIDGGPSITVTQPNQFVTVTVPSNYGRIYLT